MAWFDDDDLWIALGPRFRSAEALAEAERQVDAAIALTGIVPGARVLDLGSGPGRHALAFADRGFDVTAVDRTPSYLAHLAATARGRGHRIEIVRRDARDFSRPRAYDAALCLDVLDLFDDDGDLIRVLTNLRTALVPGGRAVVSVLGKEVVARRFVPRDWAWLRPGTLLLEAHRPTDDFGHLETRATVVEGGRIQKFDLVRRLLSGAGLRALLERAGFAASTVYGDFDGAPFDRDARRLVAVAER